MALSRTARLAPLLLLACKAEPEAVVAPSSPPVVIAPTSTSAPPRPPTSSAAPSASSPAAQEPRAFVLAELPPTRGALVPLIAAEVARARQRGLTPLVELYADWCPPCRAFQASLTSDEMKRALGGVLLIKVNVSDWEGKLGAYEVKSIPFFVIPNADGTRSERVLDGDRWRRPTPASMSAAVGAFLARPP